MAKVELQNGKSVPMAELKIGDIVQTGIKFVYNKLMNLLCFTKLTLKTSNKS